MSTPKIYYKAIRSNRHSVLNTAMPVTYPANKWAKPRIKGTPLMVFEHREQAEKFVSGQVDRVPSLSLIVVPCHIKKMRNKVKWLNWNIDLMNRNDIMAFWRCRTRSQIEKFYQYSAFDNFIQGTVFASEVKCLE